jgi:Arc/MetJ-type ribon-helix-helix transcriptional regulator
MRQALSISLSKEIIEDVKTTAEKRGFASVSDYIKQLIQEDKDLISADQLLSYVKEAEKEYRSGKMATANSLADLL